MNGNPELELDPEAARVAAALRALAAESRPPRPLPTAGQVWWRAEVVRRLNGDPGESEARPALWGEAVGIAMAVLLLVVFLSFQALALMKLLAGKTGPVGMLIQVALGLLPLVALGLAGFLLARRA